jgi:leucyl/phenylalanyl-tRNA---protein transferase
LEELVPRDTFFPEFADRGGLVAAGGDLSPESLLRAYSRGIFPWFDENSPILWWSPEPRAIIELDGLHISHRLARTIRSGKFKITVNRAFGAVMRGCGERRDEGTWITAEMLAAYERFHQLGHAHSIEAWEGDQLAGGIYGVALGGLFAGESMFTRSRDASKVCLAWLVQRLKERGFTLFDVQLLTPHTSRMGAIEIPRANYLRRLGQALPLSAVLE